MPPANAACYLHLDEHDSGQAHDLKTAQILSRGRALGLLGTVGGTLAMAACVKPVPASTATTNLVIGSPSAGYTRTARVAIAT